MSINAKNTSQPRELVPAGNYIARCYSMIHLGSANDNFQGELKKINKVRISWELPTELKVYKEGEQEKPMTISQEFTLSMHEKANLRKFLEGWRGKGFTEEEAESFDITKLLEIPCMLSVIHKTSKKGSEYDMISNAATLPKGMECPPQVNSTFEFNFEDKFDSQILENFPDFIKDRIKNSDEFKKILMPENRDIKNEDENSDLNQEKDDLPF